MMYPLPLQVKANQYKKKKKILTIGLSLILALFIGLATSCNRTDIPENPVETQSKTMSIEEFRQHMLNFNLRYAEEHPADLDTRGFKEWFNKNIWTPIKNFFAAVWQFIHMVLNSPEFREILNILEFL